MSSESASLGENNEPIEDRRMIRSLPSRFDTKIYVIEEAYDITTMLL